MHLLAAEVENTKETARAAAVVEEAAAHEQR